MTRAEQREARARRLNRLAQQRWRDKQPKPVKDDSQEEFILSDPPPPVARPAAAVRPGTINRCQTCQEPASNSTNEGWFCCRPSCQQSAARRALPKNPAPTVQDLPELPRQDPRLFDRRYDPYRPAWVDLVDPNPQPIMLAASPKAAYRFGAQVVAAEAAEAANEATAKAAAERKAQDHSAHAYWEEL